MAGTSSGNSTLVTRQFSRESQATAQQLVTHREHRPEVRSLHGRHALIHQLQRTVGNRHVTRLMPAKRRGVAALPCARPAGTLVGSLPHTLSNRQIARLAAGAVVQRRPRAAEPIGPNDERDRIELALLGARNAAQLANMVLDRLIDSQFEEESARKYGSTASSSTSSTRSSTSISPTDSRSDAPTTSRTPRRPRPRCHQSRRSSSGARAFRPTPS